MTDPVEYRSKVLLSIQRALVGEITPDMRAVSVQYEPQTILLHVYHDGPVAQTVIDDFEAGAITQLIADFPYPERGDPAVEVQWHEHGAPAPIPSVGVLVYARAGERFAAA
jgi:hypothetical protein